MASEWVSNVVNPGKLTAYLCLRANRDHALLSYLTIPIALPFSCAPVKTYGLFRPHVENRYSRWIQSIRAYLSYDIDDAFF